MQTDAFVLLTPRQVTAGPRTRRLGSPLYYYTEVGSTNQVAGDLAVAGASEGTTVIAEAQTAGQGRLGRTWLSPRGKGLWFSVILRPHLDPARAPQITLLASVAVAAAVQEQSGLSPGIKWPNDLLLNGRKACGILTEMAAGNEGIEYIVLGVGINVNLEAADFSPDLWATATSLLLETGRPVDRQDLFQEILYQIECWYCRWLVEGFEPVRQAWKKASVTLGQEVVVNSCQEVFVGRARDIDAEGALIVEGPGGEVQRFN
ncbi:MAG: biotin--[acetyl-CoA-carboxylase] ligase, partial [Moorella sp. (in: Bacteria)]|nr:biotin--[acetyl-CoA-carboxylase] ligase [Moorella sp. (in: firmicutes)]